MKNGLYRFGFTLVEIMVVISIISILLSVLYVNFNAARESSRDAVRKTDLSQLQLALELYKAQNERYPEQGCGASLWVGPGPVSTANYSSCDDWIDGLVPEFIAELPSDPNAESINNQGFFYRTDDSGSRYKIKVKDSVEANPITSYDQEFARCPRNCGTSFCGASGVVSNTYALYSYGAECW